MKNELRMYGLTPYQLTGIQIGIQFGHAVVEYGLKYFNSDEYQNWAKDNKTFIILNGGFSNNCNPEYVGTMESHLFTLMENSIELATFHEPDLNNMLSAIVFLVDERVFNKEDYPDFEDWFVANKNIKLDDELMFRTIYQVAKEIKFSDSEEDKKVYQEWVNLVGGEKNVFLREFLKQFKLA